MEKTLVTGATGFVGAAVVRALVEKGVAVRIMARQGGSRKNLEGLSFEEVSGDIKDREAVNRAVSGCSQVYHVAGLYRTWMKQYDELIEVNVNGTVNVMDACLLHGVKKVVHTSSIGALGIKLDGSPSDESTPFNLHHLKIPYEMSKYEAEKKVFEYHKKGVPVVVVRPALVMGQGDIYPTPSGAMAINVIKGKIPSCFDGGIDVVDVDDVAQGHLLAMEKGGAGESYNLGTPGNFTTMKDLFGLIAETAGVKPPGMVVPKTAAILWAYISTFISDFITGSEPPATPGNIQILSLKKRVDFSKAVSELNIPGTPLKKIVEKTVNWYTANGYV